MINLYYSEAYWGHSQTMNGPHKVVKNLLMSLDQEKVDYAINEEKYDSEKVIVYNVSDKDNRSDLIKNYFSDLELHTGIQKDLGQSFVNLNL